MPMANELSEFFDDLRRKPEFKVYASLIREFDGGFTLAVAYFVPYPTPPKGTLHWFYGLNGSLLFGFQKPIMDAQPRTEPDGRISFHGHDGGHWEKDTDEGYGELTGAIRETFIDEPLMRKILEGVREKRLQIISWLGEQGLNVYSREGGNRPPVKSLLPAFPPDE
jgi:hypothetical protein